jgi:broad specificity phosphatase PhoE
VVLIRHGQAVKNVEDRHGGDGSSLTDLGVEQSLAVGERLARFVPFRVLYTPRTQARDFARLLAATVDAAEPVPLDLEPFNLGVLSGLSDEEARQAYPELAAQMAAYRDGRLEMRGLALPQGDTAASFHRRTVAAAATIHAYPGSVCVVGTRSVLVGLANTLRGRSPVLGGGYCEIPWQNAGYCVLTVEGEVVEACGVGTL